MRTAARGLLRIVIATLASMALFDLAPIEAVEVTSLSIASDPGDFIGQGIEATYTPQNARFEAGTYSPYTVWVSVWVPETSEDWALYFAAPNGQPLAPGMYQGATDWPNQAPSEPGLSVFGLGHACISATGWFEILEIEYGPGSQISAFRARFQQHCDASLVSLWGEVRYRADVHVDLSAPKYIPVLAEQPVTFEIQGNALDGTQSTLSATDLPSGATFVDHGDGRGTFDWTPTLAQSGAYTITFSGRDAAFHRQRKACNSPLTSSSTGRRSSSTHPRHARGECT